MEEIKNIEKMNKYTVVVVVDKMYVEKIKKIKSTNFIKKTCAFFNLYI